jgi:hypothetical protein
MMVLLGDLVEVYQQQDVVYGGAGTQTAGLAFGGIGGPGPTRTAATEAYDGSSWTAGGSLNTAVAGISGGAGTQTAAVGFGGSIPPGYRKCTESI